ncbi:MAG: sulfotransferase [Nitrospinota bacterium]|nr:sulfotransferase [Nitrospinota bacterium]MDH5677567.1 sulfotransferase [Nitrospinota bacterium]MDH5755744.1 sulfotransferase [Nitrospinota bacterium]
MTTLENMSAPYVFIVGSPRSGTTILSEVLDRHRDITQWYEPYFIWDWGIGNLDDDVRVEGMLTPDHRRFIQKEFGLFRQKSGSKVVIDKSPEHCFKIPFVQAVFPEARWIHLIRDGRDVTLSIKREWDLRRDIVKGLSLAKFYREVSTMMRLHHFWRNRIQIGLFEFMNMKSLNPLKYLNKSKWKGTAGWGPRFPGWQEELEKLSLAQFTAMQWARSVEYTLEGLAAAPKGNVLDVRYEEFLDRPDEQLERICGFLGLEYDRGWNMAHDLRPANQGKWKTDLTPELRKEIGPVITPALIKLGYVDSDSWYKGAEDV